jgi:Uma2 family endonuclease
MLGAGVDRPEISMAVSQQPMTLEAFLALPEKKPALEFFDGEVTQKVPPTTAHSAMQYFFSMLVNSYSHPRRLAWAFPEHRSSYANASTVPDVSVYTWDRVPRDADRRLAERVFTTPDIAVEIRSPGQSFQSMTIRSLWYVANGAQVALAIDPRELLLIALRPAAEPLVFHDAGELDLSDVIPGFTLDIGELFAPLAPDWDPGVGGSWVVGHGSWVMGHRERKTPPQDPRPITQRL